MVASCGLSLTARELVDEIDIEDEDREVIRFELECAGLELARVVRLLHPEWAKLDDGALSSRAIKIFRRNRPDLYEDEDDLCRLGWLLEDACARGMAAIAGAKSSGFEENDEVARVLSNGMAAVYCAVHLLDPCALPRMVSRSSPDQRVKLAALIEMVELDIENHRDVARRRSRSPD